MVLGFRRGFVQELISLISWGCAFIVPFFYYANFTDWFIGIQGLKARIFLSVILLFVSVLVFGNIVSSFVGYFLKKIRLSRFNKILGCCFGLFRGLLFVSIITAFMPQSNTLTPVPRMIERVSHMIPQYDVVMKKMVKYIRNIPHLYSSGILKL